MQHLWQTHKFIYFIIIILFHIYIEYFFCPENTKGILQGKEGNSETPKQQSEAAAQQSKQKIQVFSMPRGLALFHLLSPSGPQ